MESEEQPLLPQEGNVEAEASLPEAAAFGKRLPAMGAVPAMGGPADIGLGTLSMPTATVKRIARNAAPQARFSSEALGALHRVGQAFVCFVTDRAIHELQGNMVQAAGKKKGKAAPGMKKTLGVEHVMNVLARDMPAVSSKVSSLFPDLVPVERRPPEVRMLEMLHEQHRKASLPPAEQAEGAPGGDAPGANGPPADGAAGGAQKRLLFGGGAGGGGGGAPAADDEGNAKKKAKTAADFEEIPAPAAKPKPPSLSSLFGKQKAAEPAATAKEEPAPSAGGVKEEVPPSFGGAKEEVPPSVGGAKEELAPSAQEEAPPFDAGVKGEPAASADPIESFDDPDLAEAFGIA